MRQQILLNLFRFHAPDAPVKRLRLLCGMRRDIQFFRISVPPFFSHPGKQHTSDPASPELRRHMQTGKLKILPAGTETGIFKRCKPDQSSVLKRPCDRSACCDRIPQTFHKKAVILRRPLLCKRNIFQHSSAIFPAPAPHDILITVKRGEQFNIQFRFRKQTAGNLCRTMKTPTVRTDLPETTLQKQLLHPRALRFHHDPCKSRPAAKSPQQCRHRFRHPDFRKAHGYPSGILLTEVRGKSGTISAKLAQFPHLITVPGNELRASIPVNRRHKAVHPSTRHRKGRPLRSPESPFLRPLYIPQTRIRQASAEHVPALP